MPRVVESGLRVALLSPRLHRARGQYLAWRGPVVRSAATIKLYIEAHKRGPECWPLKLKSAVRRCPPMNYDVGIPYEDHPCITCFVTTSLAV